MRDCLVFTLCMGGHLALLLLSIVGAVTIVVLTYQGTDNKTTTAIVGLLVTVFEVAGIIFTEMMMGGEEKRSAR